MQYVIGRPVRLLTAAVALLTAAGCTGPGAAGDRGEVAAPGAVVPAFSGKTTTGATVRFPGDKPSVAFFMAGWCLNCIQEAQALASIRAEFGDQVDVLAVSIFPQDTPETIKDFLSQAQAPDLPVLVDKDGSIVTRLKVIAMDTTIITDAAGREVYRDSYPTDAQTLRKQVLAAVDKS